MKTPTKVKRGTKRAIKFVPKKTLAYSAKATQAISMSVHKDRQGNKSLQIYL